jgi:chromosome segregation ATPase
MSLFKERASNAKKVIALQNEIFSLKNQLKQKPAPADCPDCSELESMLQEALSKVESISGELKSIKSDLKKSRSEVTRLNKKLSSLSNDS